MYLSFRGSVAKVNTIIHPRMEYLVVRRHYTYSNMRKHVLLLVRPTTYLSIRDLVAKEKPIIHPSMEYLVVRR